GLFALFISKKANKIICFEPEKENFRLLKKNVKINNINNIIINNCAITKTNKKIKLFFPKGKNYGGFSIFRKRNCSYEWVKSKTPQKAFGDLDEIDLLKIDCEGCEFEILPLIKLESVNALYMEYHLSKGKKKKFIMDILKKHFRKIKEKKYNSSLGLIFAEK
ncbi:MAG: FkbM family methyltransferase, partial [Candidatus Pacearchaeota archaeon]